MKQITYAGLDFVTGDDIANALLDLVAQLGTASSTLNVEIPAYDRQSKRVSVVDFVIGPSSEIVAVPMEADGYPELDEAEAVEKLHRLAAEASVVSHPIAEREPSIETFDDPIDDPIESPDV